MGGERGPRRKEGRKEGSKHNPIQSTPMTEEGREDDVKKRSSRASRLLPSISFTSHSAGNRSAFSEALQNCAVTLSL